MGRRKRYRNRDSVRMAAELEVNVKVTTCTGTSNLAASAGNRLFLWKDGEGKGSKQACSSTEVAVDPPAAPFTCLEMSPCGRYLASAGEDKVVKMWKVEEKEEDNRCTCTCLWSSAPLPKRASALAFSPRSDFLYIGDKFGEVHCVSVLAPNRSLSSSPKVAAANGNNKGDHTNNAGEGDAQVTRVLGHFCSIITSIAVCPQHKLLATADRDRKVRVTCIPSGMQEQGQPQAMPEIQSYCVGPENFANHVFFVTSELLITGGADGFIRMWNAVAGKEVAALQADLEGNDNTCLASLCYIEKKALLVSLSEAKTIALVKVDTQGRKLKHVKCQVGLIPPGFLPATMSLSTASVDAHPNETIVVGGTSFMLLVAGCVADKEDGDGKVPVSAVIHTLQVNACAGNKKMVSKNNDFTATWREDAFSPWEDKATRPLLVEDRKQYSGLRTVMAALIKPVFPLSEREYRKRNTKQRRTKSP
jgi:WD40 repeat protein